MFLLAGVIEETLIEHPEPMAGLFLGLVAASGLITGRDVEWTAGRLAAAGLVGLALFRRPRLAGRPGCRPGSPRLIRGRGGSHLRHGPAPGSPGRSYYS
ncbi:MAG: hypothetical protein CM1200mP26_27220 [Acidimicrobiales bacterium]|nr:MAG: hypothetical protein CM1200mP26_27220 [Acidimicrobiales bacterium]